MDMQTMTFERFGAEGLAVLARLEHRDAFGDGVVKPAKALVADRRSTGRGDVEPNAPDLKRVPRPLSAGPPTRVVAAPQRLPRRDHEPLPDEVTPSAFVDWCVVFVVADRTGSGVVTPSALVDWCVVRCEAFGPASVAGRDRSPRLVGWFDLGPILAVPMLGDAFVTTLTVLPWFVYLTLTESGPAAATWGKRRCRLAVIAITGARAGLGSIAMRNIVKVLPWQFGHLAAQRFASGRVTATAIGCYVAALGLLTAVAGPPLRARRGLHDRVAGTMVRRLAPFSALVWGRA